MTSLGGWGGAGWAEEEAAEGRKKKEEEEKTGPCARLSSELNIRMNVHEVQLGS